MTIAPEHISLLLTYAQLSIAFAGFAGVIGAFSRFTVASTVVAFRVRGMVVLALITLSYSLAPFAPAGFGVPTDIVWRMSCGFAFTVGAVAIPVFALKVLPLFRQRLLHTQWVNYAWYAIGVAALAANAAAVTGLIPGAAAGVHFLTLMYLTVVCAYNFVMLIMSVRFDDAS